MDIDVQPPCAEWPCKNNPEQSFYNYFDLARVAHDSEISQLREENERLKGDVRRFLNYALSSELQDQKTESHSSKIINAGISVGMSNGSDTEYMREVNTPKTSFESEHELIQFTAHGMTSCDADQLMLDDLGEIVLLEREPGDAAPEAVTKPSTCFTKQESERSTHVGELPEHVLPSDLELDSCCKRSGWEVLTSALFEVWNSDDAVIHPSWQVTLHVLSVMLQNEEGNAFTREISERFARNQRRAHHELSWKSLSCGVLLPDAGFVVIWQCLGMLLCLYDIVLFPMNLIDLSISTEYVNVANLALTIFWSADIMISLQTGFHTKEGYKELRHFEILKRYARTWMLLDTSIVAFDWVMLALNSSDSGSIRSVSRVMRFARMVRVGRLLKLGPSIIKFMGQLNSEAMLTVSKLVAYLIIILILNHYIACVVYATWSDFGVSSEYKISMYLVSLHWAIAHSALGSMDVAPSNDFERLFSTVILVLSMVLFSTFLSAITNAITHLSDLRGYRVKQEGLIRRFFDENHISRELSTRIWTFIWKHNHTGKHRLRADDVHCFAFLPSHLLAEVKVEMFLPSLLVHPLFGLCNERCPESLYKLCMGGVEQAIVRPSEEMLWSMHADVKSMLFVIDGCLLYQPQYDPMWNFKDVPIHKGMWACEAALWCQHAALSGPLIGGPAGADVMMVCAAEFRHIMQGGKLCLVLLDYARIFIQKFNELSQDLSSDDFLFNSAELVNSLIAALEAKKDSKKRRSSAGFWLNAMTTGMSMRATANFLFARKSQSV